MSGRDVVLGVLTEHAGCPYHFDDDAAVYACGIVIPTAGLTGLTEMWTRHLAEAVAAIPARGVLAPVRWDETTDYVSPVSPGDRVVLVREATAIVGTVKRTEGYAAGVVLLDSGVTVDMLDGWRLGVVA